MSMSNELMVSTIEKLIKDSFWFAFVCGALLAFVFAGIGWLLYLGLSYIFV